MAVYTVHRGARYRATIRLGVFQSAASNQQVADRFTVVGFTEVTVTGSGRNRRHSTLAAPRRHCRGA
jgi:hypothetical protein